MAKGQAASTIRKLDQAVAGDLPAGTLAGRAAGQSDPWPGLPIVQRLSTVFSPFNWKPRLLELPTTGSLEQALNEVFPDYAPR